ncbi:uncharacterized protein LOC127847798 [Dreissena polymorpha]|uniref:uncharacterized protein LOC127847798 n=1 Tax=Dreissena polymorpha TaxID=45954 RepID=UPI00226426D5|nr:uncharacterized protein LOC127847798 [Dreissena polymorpha]
MDLTAEQRRLQNIADNKRILAEIGLISTFKSFPKVQLKKSGLKRKAEDEIPRKVKKQVLAEDLDQSNLGSIRTSRRRSARIRGKPASECTDSLPDDDFEDEDEEDTENRVQRVAPNRPNFYGAVEGVEVGASWYTRMECCRDGIHRPTVAGIHAGPDGAYSIALSGGYDDNIDLGECFTYTGEGGRDLKGTKTNPKNLRTAPQSKDQNLTRGNLALSRSVETRNPVRVIRGYKLTSPFAPDEGYRYDGLYTVEKAWYTPGLSGYMVWKFALKRCPDQAAPSWTISQEIDGLQSPVKENVGDTKKEKGTESGVADAKVKSDDADKDALDKNGKQKVEEECNTDDSAEHDEEDDVKETCETAKTDYELTAENPDEHNESPDDEKDNLSEDVDETDKTFDETGNKDDEKECTN